jgi:hypothetical protein
MPLFQPIFYLAQSTGSAIFSLSAEHFGFFSDHAGADAAAGFESSKQLSSWHCFSLEIGAALPIHVDGCRRVKLSVN